MISFNNEENLTNIAMQGCVGSYMLVCMKKKGELRQRHLSYIYIYMIKIRSQS